MKRIVLKWMKRTIIVLPLFVLFGCRSDQLSLEHATISLVLGIDKGQENGEMNVYQTNPVFSMEAKEPVSTISTSAHSLVEARGKLDSQSSGTVVGGKLQVILLGKELVSEKSMFPYMDVLYRNPKNTPNARIAIVDGMVEDIIQLKPEDKPRIAVFLADLIDTTHLRESTVKTTLNDWHHAYFEKGITPAFTELEIQEGSIVVTGTALFNKMGTYEYSLDYLDSAMLLMLKKQIDEPVPISLPLDDDSLQMISFRVEKAIHRLKKISYSGEDLMINTDLNLTINISENNSSLNLEEDMSKVKRFIHQKLQKEFQRMLEEMQEHQVDPMGYGTYVRAYEYEKWKTVEDKWPEAFSNAQVTVNTKIDILGHGVVD